MNNPGKASELKKANRKKKKLAKKSKRSDTNKNNAKPQPQDKIELPTSPVNHTIPLHLRLSDLSHAGVKAFLNTVFRSSDIPQTLDQCLKNVRKLLYPPELADALAGAEIREKEVRSITLVIRDMEGVAYTTGNQLDDAHKEIHLSANYILSSGEPPTPDDAIKHAKDEVIGVIVHEMVHTVQHDGKGTAPGGFIEGAADWVRALACGPAAHWDIYAIGKK
ncbi:BSP-domain-containing protein [Violaceomyces palustris]|uniref:BSP-domain-containing protein n=1 Tax=Violaceomyces palustris TaxID=1673888 RepID=A0ACD0P8B1_9BASI|nr:BSP-domain-containing protein [Violaceomyces palustris]